MIQDTMRQFRVYLVLLVILAILAGISSLLPLGVGLPQQQALQQAVEIPPAILVIANVIIIIVLYGPLGWLGCLLARKLDLPGIFREGASIREHFARPLVIGAISGIAAILIERIFLPLHGLGLMPHPAFPMSVIGSLSAGIGEEILFRLFMLSLWAYLSNLMLGRYGLKQAALWIGIVIGALTFGAAHAGTVMFIYGLNSFSQVPVALTAEILLLNGVIGVLAGREFLRYGLMAAAGIHFWADVIWHVIYGLIG